MERFLPYIDNWATCDQLIVKAFYKNRKELLPKIVVWLGSEHSYTVRFAIGLLMRYFLDELFSTRYLEMVASVKSNDYYVHMMIAWYFATALAKQYDTALPYFIDNRLDRWVHNKAIQKARESFRIDKTRKEEIKKLVTKA